MSQGSHLAAAVFGTCLDSLVFGTGAVASRRGKWKWTHSSYSCSSSETSFRKRLELKQLGARLYLSGEALSWGQAKGKSRNNMHGKAESLLEHQQVQMTLVKGVAYSSYLPCSCPTRESGVMCPHLLSALPLRAQ